jgi:hypothetical protein
VGNSRFPGTDGCTNSASCRRAWLLELRGRWKRDVAVLGRLGEKGGGRGAIGRPDGVTMGCEYSTVIIIITILTGSYRSTLHQ